MVVKLQTKFCASLCIAFQFATNLQAGIFWGHPYQDRHFNYNSTPRYSNGVTATATQGGLISGTSNDVAGSSISTATSPASGGGCRNCGETKNAILRLWIPDDLEVEINGYKTRPQMLGGVHQGSRVFNLDGLERDHVSPCDIVVNCCDEHGNVTMRLRREIPVQAGGHYEVHFPKGFEPVQAEFEHAVIDSHLLNEHALHLNAPQELGKSIPEDIVAAPNQGILTKPKTPIKTR